MYQQNNASKNHTTTNINEPTTLNQTGNPLQPQSKKSTENVITVAALPQEDKICIVVHFLQEKIDFNGELKLSQYEAGKLLTSLEREIEILDSQYGGIINESKTQGNEPSTTTTQTASPSPDLTYSQQADSKENDVRSTDLAPQH